MVTPALIVACMVVYAAQMLLDPRGGGTGGWNLTPRFWVVGGDGFAWWRTVSYAFLHGGLLHLVGNMLFLWVFGRAVEDRMGRVGFTAFYLGGGAFAGLMHAWLEAGPAVGASGAIAAVTGAFLVLFPRTKIKVLWFFILISLVMAPAWFFIGLQIAWNLLAQATGTQGNVAVIAHLAGYAYGFTVAFVLLSVGVLKREPYDLFSITSHAKRRAEFRALNTQTPARGPAAAAARPPSRPVAERTEALAKARAAVSAELSLGRPEGAIGPYRELLERFGSVDGAATLSRTAQYQLATALYTTGEPTLALRAFGDFLEAYPRDPETPQIRILIGRLLAGEGRLDEARRELARAITEIRDPALASLARAELDTIGEGASS